MNVKDLFENKELMENIVEDITDIPQDTEVTYEVWALGYNKEDEPTDDEVLIAEFTDPDAAVKCAEDTTLKVVEELGFGEMAETTAYFSIEVETVVVDPEDGGFMNIGSVYQRDLWLDGEYGSEEDFEDDYEPLSPLKADEYTLLDDGTLKVSCKILKDFNKNDYVYFRFVDAPNSFPLQYKIVSKVIYEDGDYYHCEFMF